MKIYGDEISGNCLKIKWVADHLSLPYTWHDVDLLAGETRSEDFLQINPCGQVPVVVFEDGRTLAQSNAIIRYLARDSLLLPADPFVQAEIDQWMFWEQYSHEPYIAVCRFHMHYLGRSQSERDDWRVERGEQALDLMDSLFQERRWLVARQLTVADVALVAYTRLAHEGGFSLEGRPNIQRWISDCEQVLNIAV